MTQFTESLVEEAALAWIESSGWQIAHVPDITPDMPGTVRAEFGEVVLQIYVKQANGGFTLTDGGCKLERRKRPNLLKMTLNRFGVQLDGNALQVHAAPENFALRKHNLVQAINRSSRDTAQAVVRAPSSRAYTLLNDSDHTVSQSAVDALLNYDLQPVFWNERESVRAELAA